MKTLSKKRVIGSFDTITKNNEGKILFDKIKTELISHYFSKQYLERENTIKDLLKENNRIKDLNKQLQQSNGSLQKDNEEKAKKIKTLYWKLNKTDYFKKQRSKNGNRKNS